MRLDRTSSGFTLIELSIVLVIIGLIVGGVLVGRDLIASATVRAQISQIEKFQQAANTFRGKYGYLPGDLPDSEATKFGLMGRTNIFSQGDGLLSSNSPTSMWGKQLLFWRDLSDTKLIAGNFGRDLQNSSSFMPVSFNYDTYLPYATIGQGSAAYVYSTSSNYFSISAPVALDPGVFQSKPGMTVQQAYNIDKKVDDGIPMSGRTSATYFSYFVYPYVDPITGDGVQGSYGGIITANDCHTADCAQGNTSNTADQNCFVDSQTYNISYPGNVNCTLSFKFQ